MKLTHKHGGDVDAPESLKLRSIIRDLEKKFPSMKKLQASKTAAEGVVEIAYVEYVRFSLDGVHCSLARSPIFCWGLHLPVAGAHFRAASNILKAAYPGVRIIGLFIARRVPEAVDWDKIDL